MRITLDLHGIADSTFIALDASLYALESIAGLDEPLRPAWMRSQDLRSSTFRSLRRTLDAATDTITLHVRAGWALYKTLVVALEVSEEKGILPDVIPDQIHLRRELLILLGRLFAGSLDDVLVA